jgi:uncharacterized oligopeptide transporter (OPT) family protein
MSNIPGVDASQPAIPPLPDDATPEQKDQHWLKHVYQGDRMPQLTWRAVLMGGVLGMVMSAANLYTTLSIGWAFGIAITSCVLSFVIWNMVRLTSGKRVSQMSVLENACMASTASAAGYSTGSTIATMFGALVLLKDVPEGTPLSSIQTWDVTEPWILITFTLCTGLMGVFLAIPMKRQQINHEQLPFPSGIAAAETLRSLYSASRDAVHKAYALVVALFAGLLIGFLRAGEDVLESVRFLKRLFEHIPFLRIPAEIEMHVIDRLYPAGRHAAGFAFEPSALLIAAGMIVGMRTSLSLLVGSLLLYGVFGPQIAGVDAKHFNPAAQAVVEAYDAAAKDKADLSVIAKDATAAIEAAIVPLGLDDNGAVVRAAKAGARDAHNAVETARSIKSLEAMLKVADEAGLDEHAIERAVARTVRAAGEGENMARAAGAIEEAVRLAGAGPAEAQIRDAAAKARREAETRTDKDVGDVTLAAVLAAAREAGANTEEISAKAAAAAKAARANPGRTGAAEALKAAEEIIYDRMENDPTPVQTAYAAALGEANAKAAKTVEEAMLAAVLQQAGTLKLDAQRITTAAADAGTKSSASEAVVRHWAAEQEIVRHALAAKVDPAPILKAGKGVSFSDDEKEKHLKDLREAIVGGPRGAAGSAGVAFANRDATKAQAAAKAEAKTKGLSYKKTKVAGEEAFDKAKYRPALIWNWGADQIVITRWSLWGGTSIMVFASLMSVALQWKTIVRAFTGIRKAAHESAHDSSKLQDIEVPGSWMVLGMLPITIAMVWLQIQAFGVSWYAGVIAVAMSFVLSLVASRATGETDTTPIGAMGKVMQLLFAILAPKNIAANLASAGIAANSASSSADLLTDLKTGYLLGANPRKQFLAQFYGVFFGTVAIVPIWYLMVPTREKLESFALPSTRAWEAVARVLVKGVSELPDSAVTAIFVGAAVGCILPVIERLLPPKARKYMPSATGLGLAWVMPFQNAFSFFVGAVIAMIWRLFHKRSQDNYNVPVASGLIAGESLMAAALAITATVVGLLASK